MNLLKIFSPARFDLAGGTLDLPPISSILSNALTVNCTLDKGVYITFEESEKIILKNENSQIEEKFPSNHPDLILFSKAVEFFKEKISYPLKITVNSQLPKGSGLGVSSVIIVSILKGLSVFFDMKISKKELVYSAANIEASLINCPAGLQDYIAPLYGSISAIEFPHSGFTVNSIDLSNVLKDNLLFIFTGISHFSGQPNWELLKLFIENDFVKEKFKELALTTHCLLDGVRQNQLEIIGKMMKQDFELRKLMPVKLIPYLPQLFSVLEKCHNILGFKLCGAAGGGTIAVLTKKDKLSEVRGMLKIHGIDVLDMKPSEKKFEVIN